MSSVTKQHNPHTSSLGSPFLEIARRDWARLSAATTLPLTQDDVYRLQSLGESLDLAEVEEVYLPMSRLLNLYVGGTGQLHSATSTFLGELPSRTPFVIGVAGSVAVGKSTTSRILRELLSRWPGTPRVELLTTDGFLYPNIELTRRGILDRKGFPESYDRRALLRFVSSIKAGAEEVRAPVYSHITYDIVPHAQIVVRRPDVLIVEGLNVLAPPSPLKPGRQSIALSDFFDFSIYVDADISNLRSWYIERFLSLRSSSFSREDSYFRKYANLNDEQAVARASHIWATINEPNLVQNILPTRARASLVLRKDAHHKMNKVLLRKL